MRISRGAGKFDLTDDAVKHQEVEDARFEAQEGAGNFAGLDFGEYLGTRPEIGFTRMLLNFAFEPQYPFKPDTRRNFRKGFVLAVVVFTAFIAWLLWFNVIR